MPKLQRVHQECTAGHRGSLKRSAARKEHHQINISVCFSQKVKQVVMRGRLPLRECSHVRSTTRLQAGRHEPLSMTRYANGVFQTTVFCSVLKRLRFRYL